MATNDQRFGDSVYIEAVFKPLRNSKVKWVVLFEVLLFVGGYYVSSLSPPQAGFTAGPPFQMAAGVTMGAFGIAFGAMLLVVYVGLVIINLRSQTARGRDF